MEDIENKRTFDLTNFAKASKDMVAKNTTNIKTFNDYFNSTPLHNYSKKEILDILQNGSIDSQQKLSRDFFNNEGQYKQFVLYLANLLKYTGILIPNPAYGKKLSTDHIQKRYFAAMDFIENLKLPKILPEIAVAVFRDGCYYGVISKITKKKATILDLPLDYCRSLYKDSDGNDVVEFNLNYFNNIFDEKNRAAAVRSFPKFIADAWKKYSKGKISNNWIVLPDEIVICFPYLDGRPPLVNVIPSLKDYKQAVDLELRREISQIKKIVIQQIPYDKDLHDFVFVPEEAAEIHKGTVDMMANDETTEVLTSYADVQIADTKTSVAGTQENLKRMAQHVNQEVGLTNQLFSATDSTTTNDSLRKDLSLVMVLGNKMADFITKLVNNQFANSNVDFKYSILPITWQNDGEYLDKTFKLVNNGYSLLLPALALDLTQRDLINLKELENDVLNLDEKLLPPQLSYTQSGDEKTLQKDEKKDAKKELPKVDVDKKNGRPRKDTKEKKESTIKKDESIERNGGQRT